VVAGNIRQAIHVYLASTAWASTISASSDESMSIFEVKESRARRIIIHWPARRTAWDLAKTGEPRVIDCWE